jgi:uncharacterized protein
MRPLSLAERWPGVASVTLRELLSGSRSLVDGVGQFGLRHYMDEIVGSGFPGIRRLRNPAALRRWMQAYAAATSTTAT